jgi:putative SOS response-associated peptidase YedK
MCNHYENDLRKLEGWGPEDAFSESRISQFRGLVSEQMFPDRVGLVAVLGDRGELRLDAMRWGFPPVQKSLVTNVRNTASSFWRPWLRTDYRCLVFGTRFAEWSPIPPKGDRWFQMADGQPFAFAGIWRPWHGTRGTKAAPAEGAHRLFVFLTTEPNAVVAPIHPKAMPVILPPSNWDQWLTGSIEEALELKRPLPDEALALAA